jgi:hypothetical protein
MNIGDNHNPIDRPIPSEIYFRNSATVPPQQTRQLRVDELFNVSGDESPAIEKEQEGTITSGYPAPPSAGLTIVGCSASCGKTILMMGLADILFEDRSAIRCIKPIALGPPLRVKPEHTFISSMGGAPTEFVSSNLQFPPVLSLEQWTEIVNHATTGDTFTMVELPGSAATPVSIFRDGAEVFSYDWKSSADLAATINYPVILVARHAPDALEQIDINLSYLQARNLRVVAVATVETNWDDARFMEKYLSLHDFEMLVTERTRVPYLGCLPFSGALAVPLPNLGRVGELTSDSMDLLLLRRSVALPL